MSAVSSSDVILATGDAPWKVAVTPFRVMDQIYYIGNVWVGAYLIDTGEGLILLDTMCAETTYLMVDAIYRLGYRPEQIRYILLSHAHIDHVGGAQMLKQLTGAKVFLSAEDDEFRHNEQALHAEAAMPADVFFRDYPYEVDCHYDDRKPIELGNVRIDTRLTPGHTPGVTTFLIHVRKEDGSEVTAAMHGGVGVLTMSDAYSAQAGIPSCLRDRFIADCEDMANLKVDVCLPSHPAHYPGDFFELSKSLHKDPDALVDYTAWRRFLTDRAAMARKLAEKKT